MLNNICSGQIWSQSYRRNLVFKKSKLVLDLKVRYSTEDKITISVTYLILCTVYYFKIIVVLLLDEIYFIGLLLEGKENKQKKNKDSGRF